MALKKKPRILIVEDESELLALCKEMLIEKGFDVDTDDSGLTAFVDASVNTYDLIVTDLNMPKVSGQEFIREIRGKPQYKNVPIVILSGHVNKEIIAEFASDKNIHVLEKPTDIAFVADKVKQILG